MSWASPRKLVEEEAVGEGEEDMDCYKKPRRHRCYARWPRQNGDTATTFVETMPSAVSLPSPVTSVASLTPHLYAPDAVRPLRAKEHFLSADTFVELHQHPWPQLTFSTRGVIRLSTQDGSYIVPPSRAVWVPANMPHSICLLYTSDAADE